VHGCCTDENDVVRDWGNGTPGNTGMAKAIADNIHSPTNEAWEVVVWDWHEYTPKHNYLATALAAGIPATITLIIADADAAYENAKDQGDVLANAIKLHPYKYVHFIAHSAGAKLIQEAATAYMGDYSIRQQNPFIHLTFLDAYTPTESDSSGQGSYGYFPTASPHHYSEHYVDRGVASTDACLSSAFNFDITNWDGADKNPLDPHSGHTWPIRWYKQSVTGSGFHYGYPLSFESSGKDINTLINELSNYPPGKQCALSDIGASCIKALCPSPGSF
jgi:hypothetical protein